MKICTKKESTKKLLIIVAGNLYRKEDNKFFIGNVNGDLISLEDGCCWNKNNGFGTANNAVAYYGWEDVTEEYCIAPIDKD